MAVKAKFVCYAKEDTKYPQGGVLVRLAPVQASDKNPENEIFGEATPSGHLDMVILNPPASAYFEEKKEYYLTIEKADN